MATAEIEEQPNEELEIDENEASANDVETGANNEMSKLSVVSESFDPRLSTILEKDPSLVEQPSVTRSVSEYRKRKWETLARPKALHLEDTLNKYERQMSQQTVERMKSLIRQQRDMEKHSCKPLFREPAPKEVKTSRNSQKIYQNLQCSLRKVAFEMMANKIFDRMPDLILEQQQRRPKQLAPDTKALLESLQVTLQRYLGSPANEYEERVFQHLCYGLAVFVENIIESVHKEGQDQDDESKPVVHRYSPAVELARKAFKERQ